MLRAPIRVYFLQRIIVRKREENQVMTEDRLTKILYVEDDNDIQQIAQFSLETVGGYELKICNSGEEAIEQVPSFKPELILLDVWLPGMDGFKTLEALREIPDMTDIPVVFMTASAQTHEVAEYKKIGATDVIPKPFDPMTLPDTINEIWTKYLNQS
jgi:CheY-like chemotaxis protein